jgi:hypothetical protein
MVFAYLSLVSARPVVFTFFNNPGCSGTKSTLTAQSGICQTVPNNLQTSQSINAPKGNYMLYQDAGCSTDLQPYSGNSCLGISGIGSILVLD